MANEFHYSVSLVICHPTLDPNWITERLKILRPNRQFMAGTERTRPDGTLLTPVRKADMSFWRAPLHQEEQLFSGTVPFSDFIEEQLTQLEPFSDVLAEIKQQGQLSLFVGWFSDTSHSATLLNSTMLRKCGELGIDIELYFYGP